MEIKLIFFVIILILINGCIADISETYFINDYSHNGPIKIEPNEKVVPIHLNLYKYKNKVHVGLPYSVAELGKNDAIVYNKKGIYLQDSIDNKAVSNLF